MQRVERRIEADIERERLGAHLRRQLGLGTCCSRPRQVSSSTKDMGFAHIQQSARSWSPTSRGLGDAAQDCGHEVHRRVASSLAALTIAVGGDRYARPHALATPSPCEPTRSRRRAHVHAHVTKRRARARITPHARLAPRPSYATSSSLSPTPDEATAAQPRRRRLPLRAERRPDVDLDHAARARREHLERSWPGSSRAGSGRTRAPRRRAPRRRGARHAELDQLRAAPIDQVALGEVVASARASRSTRVAAVVSSGR